MLVLPLPAADYTAFPLSTDLSFAMKALGRHARIPLGLFHCVPNIAIRVTSREDQAAALMQCANAHGVVCEALESAWLPPFRLNDPHPSVAEATKLEQWLVNYFTQVQVRYVVRGATDDAR
jgi:hypothetical protein